MKKNDKCGGYLEYCGVFSTVEFIFSTVGDTQYHGNIMMHVGGYHEYHGAVQYHGETSFI